jgi:hypothetical protein
MVRTVIYILICSIFKSSLCLATPIAISIGAHCEVAIQLRQQSIRSEAFPFDWITSANCEGVIQACKDDLAYCIDPSYFREENGLITNAYQFYFVHDFSIKTLYSDDEKERINAAHPDFEKYCRRIKRFNELLSTTQEHIVFIRISHITDEQARQFVAVMQERYPQVSFTLAVVLEIYDADPSFDWDIPQAKVFYLAEKNEDGSPKAGRSDEWKSIFYELGLIES